MRWMENFWHEPAGLLGICGVSDRGEPFPQLGGAGALRVIADADPPGADIHAPEAWDQQYLATNVIVAVVDTGIRYTHQDLAANMWASPVDGSHGLNVVSNGARLFPGVSAQVVAEAPCSVTVVRPRSES